LSQVLSMVVGSQRQPERHSTRATPMCCSSGGGGKGVGRTSEG
jgi:hypothetical protein